MKKKYMYQLTGFTGISSSPFMCETGIVYADTPLQALHNSVEYHTDIYDIDIYSGPTGKVKEIITPVSRTQWFGSVRVGGINKDLDVIVLLYAKS